MTILKQSKRQCSRLLSILLSCSVALSIIAPTAPIKAMAAEGVTLTTDALTADGWKTVFPLNSTENAGGVWTDKSVASGDDIIRGEKAKDGEFLVGLSAIASKLKLTTQKAESKATDTVLVLDRSGSMDGYEDDLLAAVNPIIKTLMDANPKNRVAVVFFSGDADTLLPLAHYDASETAGGNTYITFEYNWIYGYYYSSAAKLKADGEVFSQESVSDDGSTDQQEGMLEAYNILKNRGTDNLPIMVLMTDGETQEANTRFSGDSATGSSESIGTSNVSLGTFATQLTASWIKRQLGTDYHMYTMGFNLEDNNALFLMEPTNTDYQEDASATFGYWTDYLTATGSTVEIENGYTFTKINGLSYDYVDKDGSFLAANPEEMTAAFESIVQMIEEESNLDYVTQVTDDANHEGYVTFLDHIGEHMEISKIRGIVLQEPDGTGGYRDTLYNGSVLAKTFKNNPEEIFGIKDQADTWTDMGNDLVRSIRTRLGLWSGNEDEREIANQRTYALIRNAWENDQFSYTDETSFTNYFGWYSDADYNCIAPWNDKADPDGEKFAEAVTDEYKSLDFPGEGKALRYLNKSYLYYNHITGNNNTLYVSVRISRDITTGQETIAFAVPASLVPTINYTVKDETTEQGQRIIEMATTPNAPITLLYDLKPGVDKYSLPLYDLTTGNKLYTNKFNDFEQLSDNKGDLSKIGENTYSYFIPNRKNVKYYFDEDTPVYTEVSDGVYEVYDGQQTWSHNLSDTNTYYYKQTIYSLDAGNAAANDVYIVLNEHELCGNIADTTDTTPYAAVHGENGWYIPKGAIPST